MNSIVIALSVAENIADRYGNIEKFKADYTFYRSKEGLLPSMAMALKDQNLWNIFVSTSNKNFMDTYFSKI